MQKYVVLLFWNDGEMISQVLFRGTFSRNVGVQFLFNNEGTQNPSKAVLRYCVSAIMCGSVHSVHSNHLCHATQQFIRYNGELSSHTFH